MKILHANDDHGSERFASIFADCEITVASTLKAAIDQLDRPFDLIIVGVHFDDSRAVEMLQQVRKSKLHKHTPFFFVRTRDSSLATLIHKSIKALGKAYKYNGYIETELFGDDDERIRAAILGKLKVK